MEPTTTPARARAAIVSGITTTAYYASPDLVRSRTARAWIKAACLGAAFAASLPDLRTLRAARDADPEPVAPTGTSDAIAPSRRVVLATTASVVGGLALMVATERWIFRRGEVRAAAGVPLAHTRPAVVLGLITAALAVLPEPSGTEAPASTPGGADR
jgi:hypothetical protein